MSDNFAVRRTDYPLLLLEEAPASSNLIVRLGKVTEDLNRA
jgi:hypothetical protein